MLFLFACLRKTALAKLRKTASARKTKPILPGFYTRHKSITFGVKSFTKALLCLGCEFYKPGAILRLYPNKEGNQKYTY